MFRFVLFLLLLLGGAAYASAVTVVTVSPSSASLNSGATQQFTATVTGATNKAVYWKASAGTITASGLFTAPTVSAQTTVTVTATSTNHPGKRGTATVTVFPLGVQHSVDLSWTDSDPNVVGYSVYRGVNGGGPFALVASAISAQAYTDSTVVSGQTYYYVVTATDNTGAESGYSNEVTAVIP